MRKSRPKYPDSMSTRDRGEVPELGKLNLGKFEIGRLYPEMIGKSNARVGNKVTENSCGQKEERR